ncbi:sigma factor [Geodermatophilus maliterrae]|uniref:Sigma factor n=1 Tax=Geodermatophilus maliterrae TaxID=3162531 RepID=A0ABV3XKR8_9ACTN
MSSLTDDLRPLDEQTSGARVEPHRRELHVHCYRLLGSFEETEDLVQEAFLRAWRRRETYEGRLDALDERPRRPSASGEVAWMQPYPDELLEQLPDRRGGPEDVALAEETARLLETTEASVDSAPQRARAGWRESLPEDREAWRHAAQPTAAERELLARHVECSERADAAGPDGGFGSEAFGSMRCVVTRANGQPAVAGHLREPGDAVHEPLAIDVLPVQDGVVTEIVTFDGAGFEHFDLPATLSAAVGTR